MSGRTSIPINTSRSRLARASRVRARRRPGDRTGARQRGWEQADRQSGQPQCRSRPGTGPVRPRPSRLTSRDPGIECDPAADRRLRGGPRHELHVRQLSGLRGTGRRGHRRAGVGGVRAHQDVRPCACGRRSATHRSVGRASLTPSTAATTSRRSGVARESRTRAASARPATRSGTRPGPYSTSPPVTASPTARTRWSNPACAATARSPGGACRRSPGTRWTWSCWGARPTPAGCTPAAS